MPGRPTYELTSGSAAFSFVVGALILITFMQPYAMGTSLPSHCSGRVIALNLETREEIAFPLVEGFIEFQPEIYGNNVVWKIPGDENENGNSHDIVIGNILTGEIITIDTPTYVYGPSIYKNVVTWYDYFSHVFAYDLEDGMIGQLTELPNYYGAPIVNDQYLFGVLRTTDLSQFYLCYTPLDEPMNSTRVPVESSILGMSVINDTVFYLTGSNVSGSLWAYDILSDTHTRLLRTDGFSNNYLTTDGDRLLWRGTSALVVYDVGTGVQRNVSYDLFNNFRTEPQLSGDRIVYEGYGWRYGYGYSVINGTRDGPTLFNLTDNSSVMIVDLSPNNHTGEVLAPSIHGDWVVWYDGYSCDYRPFSYWVPNLPKEFCSLICLLIFCTGAWGYSVLMKRARDR